MLKVLLSRVKGNLTVPKIIRLKVEEHHEAIMSAGLGLHIPAIH